AVQTRGADRPGAGYFKLVCTGRRGGRRVVSHVRGIAGVSRGGEVLRMRRTLDRSVVVLSLGAIVLCCVAQAQQAPDAAHARILLVPRRMVSGERATLAVLDVGGRLTPGATIHFSNGDKVTTEATGRALFVAPLTAGVLFASIEGRPGRVATTVLPAQQGSGAAHV